MIRGDKMERFDGCYSAAVEHFKLGHGHTSRGLVSALECGWTKAWSFAYCLGSWPIVMILQTDLRTTASARMSNSELNHAAHVHEMMHGGCLADFESL